MNVFQSFPLELQKIINSLEIVEVIKGRIGDKIIKLSDRNKKLYLKISNTEMTQDEMENECRILNWLSFSRLNIPKVLFFQKNTNKSYMLLSNVSGVSSHEITKKFSKEKIVEISAKALQKVHKIDAQSIPPEYTNCLAKELESIMKNVENDMIDIEAFKEANHDKTPQTVLEYLLEKKGLFKSDVFTHGDYCLPNILIDNESNYGFVDWSQAGTGDIYRDISPMVKSINRNFGKAYSNLFLKHYGIDEDKVNKEKIIYYGLIDQFTYYKK
ncbi:phosphotransferase [Vallitalea pronyensis]|uniref:Phosphotransferase n=1 Tax=Vallitalea pronyensis TaxID=1348613 RepID=A0A8J8MGR5_9FIRM|nr:phosphotransferase [Vallitalea pronyensis]QUI21300.1 phosphotransferase [Vallitalea pronyensis]